MSKLLALTVRSRKYYKFLGDFSPSVLLLPCCVIELSDLSSHGNLLRSDVTLSSSEVEEMEPAVRTLLEAASWLDWLVVAAWLMVLANSSAVTKCHQLFVTGARRLFCRKYYSSSHCCGTCWYSPM